MAGNTDKPVTDKDKEIIRKAWPELTFLAKLKYIGSYYGVYLAAAAALILLTLFFLRDIVRKKPQDVFYVAVMESEAQDEDIEKLRDGLSACLGIDGTEGACVIETDYSGAQNVQSAATVSAYMQSGRIDLLIAPAERFNRYAAASYLAPLDGSDVSWENLIQEYRPEELLYAEPYDYGSGGAVEEIPFRPHEATDNARCYGIYLKGGIFEGYVIGIMANCPHEEYAEKALSFFVSGIDF